MPFDVVTLEVRVSTPRANDSQDDVVDRVADEVTEILRDASISASIIPTHFNNEDLGN